MAKRNKVPVARKPRADDSLLIRSAESLGRMIGSLQRQLDNATKQLSGDGTGKGLRLDDADGSEKRAARPKPAKSGSTSGATKAGSKSAAAKKTAGPPRSGATRRARKATRRA